MKDTLDAIEENEYNIDKSNYYEVCTDERFSIPKNTGEDILVIDYYIPCVKR